MAPRQAVISSADLDNNIVLECPWYLSLFMTTTAKGRQTGETSWSVRCKCGYGVAFDMNEMDPVQLWAQPQVASRIRKIHQYRLAVEGLASERAQR
ncbi:MAG: hypothetical protein OK456_06515 [Thaumarchaeota archaeon]|nr:hypothetical protein [Nitrososphaerota archaeon]